MLICVVLFSNIKIVVLRQLITAILVAQMGCNFAKVCTFDKKILLFSAIVVKQILPKTAFHKKIVIFGNFFSIAFSGNRLDCSEG